MFSAQDVLDSQFGIDYKVLEKKELIFIINDFTKIISHYKNKCDDLQKTINSYEINLTIANNKISELELRLNMDKYDIEQKYKKKFEDFDVKISELENVNINLLNQLNNKKLESNIEDNYLFIELKKQNKNLQDNYAKIDKEFKLFKIKKENENIEVLKNLKNISSEDVDSSSRTIISSEKMDTQNEINIIPKEDNTHGNYPNINTHVIPFPQNVNYHEIVFYRKIKDTNIKYLGAAIKNTSGYYLRCCEINHENNILTIDKWVTCTKCYYSYKIDSQGMIIKKILNEHIIHNESNIYHEIKCKNNKCIHINKKIINLCNKCKKNKEFEESIYFYDEVDENVIGSKIINKSIKFDYEEIYKHGELYQIGLDDGIEMHKKNVLYNYYKNYNKNLIKDIKTQKVLQNKALRCYSIMKLFNQDKYKIIQNKIKNIITIINSFFKKKLNLL